MSRWYAALSSAYGVSLTAAALKWIEIAPKRALVIATRDDFVLWARANNAAFKSGAYLPTRKRTIEVPRASLCHSSNANESSRVGIVPANIWFPKEPGEMSLMEMCLVSEYYDYTLSLLLMPDAEPRFQKQEDEDVLLTPVDFAIRDRKR